MTNDDTASNHDYSGGLSDEIYRLVKRLRGRYRGTFVFNQLGEHTPNSEEHDDVHGIQHQPGLAQRGA